MEEGNERERERESGGGAIGGWMVRESVREGGIQRDGERNIKE